MTANCNHKTRLYDQIVVTSKNGETEQIGISISTIKPDYCHRCYEKMAIRCAWCGDYILPDSAITLYTPNANFDVPEYAVSYKEDGSLKLVGCLRMDCASSGADRSGFWVIPGKVKRVLSPIEEMLL